MLPMSGLFNLYRCGFVRVPAGVPPVAVADPEGNAPAILR
jgi:hypothetical protein